MPSGRSFYQRNPERYAREKQDFQRLVAELKRLALKKAYSQDEIASEEASERGQSTILDRL
jgi:hypothetical protein